MSATLRLQMKLFVSHAHLDRHLVLPFVSQLKVAPGVTQVFFEQDELSRGDELGREISAALVGADALVGLVSVAWLNSRWCQLEWRHAERAGVRIIPVYLRPVPDFDRQPIARFLAVKSRGSAALSVEDAVPSSDEYATCAEAIASGALPERPTRLHQLWAPRERVAEELEACNGPTPVDHAVAADEAYVDKSSRFRAMVADVERRLREKGWSFAELVEELAREHPGNNWTRIQAALDLADAILQRNCSFTTARGEFLAAGIDRASGAGSERLPPGRGCWDRVVRCLLDLADTPGDWRARLDEVRARLFGARCSGPPLLRVQLQFDQGQALVAGVWRFRGPTEPERPWVPRPTRLTSAWPLLARVVDEALSDWNDIRDTSEVVLQAAVPDDVPLDDYPDAWKNGFLRERLRALTIWPIRPDGTLRAGILPPKDGRFVRPDHPDPQHDGRLEGATSEDDAEDVASSRRIGVLAARRVSHQARQSHENRLLTWLHDGDDCWWQELFARDQCFTIEHIFTRLSAMHLEGRKVQLLWTDARYGTNPIPAAVCPDALTSV